VRFYCGSLFWTICLSLGAQSSDSLSAPQIGLKSYISSATLIGSGILLNENSAKNDVQNWVRDRWEISTTSIDDYLQHLPPVMMYTLDLTTKRPLPEVERQSRHLLVSQVIALGTTYLLKEITNETRPNGGSRSFPSGHTSYAFTSAAVMWHAYKDHNKWIAGLGFIPASLTAYYRVTRDKHWVSDVLVGAGLGILSAHLSYDLNIWNSSQKNTKSKDKNYSLSIAPTDAGLGLLLMF